MPDFVNFPGLFLKINEFLIPFFMQFPWNSLSLKYKQKINLIYCKRVNTSGLFPNINEILIRMFMYFPYISLSLRCQQ